MSRPNKVWFRKSHKAYYVEYEGVQHRLADGPECQIQKKAAELAFARLIVSLAAADSLETSLSVSELFDKYLTFSKKNHEFNTFSQYARFLKSFQLLVKKDKVESCILHDLTTWIDFHEGWKSQDTKAAAAKVIKSAFSWGKTQGLLTKNPFEDFAVTFRNRRRPITVEELKRLLEAVGKNQEAIKEVILFACLTGARPGEIRAIQWFHYDEKTKIIRLKQHKTTKKTKVSKDRIFLVTPEVAVILERAKHRSRVKLSGDFIFLTYKGLPWQHGNLEHRFKYLREKANLPKDVFLYSSRHRFGTQAIINGIDIKTLAELMGHSSTQMTEHYLHLAGELTHLRTAAMKIAKASSLDSSVPQPTEDNSTDPNP